MLIGTLDTIQANDGLIRNERDGVHYRQPVETSYHPYL
jgi:hypothetical protein